METLIAFIAFVALAIVGIAAQFVGEDSRDGFDSAPRPDGWTVPSQHG
ncbi:MAG TPA: hypothetical protein VGR61_01480 [Candidatus Dormibacteraeota bacterium]|nr:hypothetical protein [Candidatus Dormibacteraeota bacterium]